MTTEDDEKLARALQAQYEKEAQSRTRPRAAGMNRKSSQRTPYYGSSSDDGGMTSGSDDEGIGAGPRRPRRVRPAASSASRTRSRRVIVGDDATSDEGGLTSGSDDDGFGAAARRLRRGRLTRPPMPQDALPKSLESGTKATASQIQDRKLATNEKESDRKERHSHRTDPHSAPPSDTNGDAELARRLAEEGNGRGKPRSSHPETAMERSSHHRSVPHPAPVQDATLPDTSADAEIARRLAGRQPRRGRSRSPPPTSAIDRSSSHGAAPNPAPAHAATLPDTSADAEIARRLAGRQPRRTGSRSPLPTSAIDRSSHHGAAPNPAPAQAATSPDTSADAELARRLAGRQPRRTESRSQLQTSVIDRSSHHGTAPDFEAVQYETVPDTSADAELARRLAMEDSRRGKPRSSHHAAALAQASYHGTAPDLEAVQYEAVPDTSADAELARRIVDKESKKIKQRLKRRTVPDLTEAPEPLNDYASRDEEIARRLGEHTEVDRCQRITLVDKPVGATVPCIDDDETLARKLEQIDGRGDGTAPADVEYKS